MLEATASLWMQQASPEGMHLGNFRYGDGAGPYMGEGDQGGDKGHGNEASPEQEASKTSS